MAFKLYLEAEDQEAVERDEEYHDDCAEALTHSGIGAWKSEPGSNGDCLFDTYEDANKAREWLMVLWAHKEQVDALIKAAADMPFKLFLALEHE